MEIHYETLPVGESGEQVECTVVAFAPEESDIRKALITAAFMDGSEVEFYPVSVIKKRRTEAEIDQMIETGRQLIEREKNRIYRAGYIRFAE